MINIKIIINYLLSSKYRRRNLITIGSLIVFLSVLLISSSSAFYTENDSINFLSAVVGDYNQNNYDIILKIYVENNNNTYSLSNIVPDNNYVYDHYICGNNSLLTYDNNTKEITIIAENREQCNAYFNLSGVANG